MGDINLTPPQELKRQKTQYVVGAATKVSLILLVIAVSLSVYFFVKTLKLKRELSFLEAQNRKIEQEIASMQDIENYAKDISGKYLILQRYLESRLKYSAIFREILSRKPVGVEIEKAEFEGMGKRSRIYGSSTNEMLIAVFMSKMDMPGNLFPNSGVLLEGKKAFTDVNLDALNVDETKKVKYTISFYVNEEVFLK